MAKKNKKPFHQKKSIVWMLGKMDVSCFVDSLDALTPEYGCKESGNYKDKVRITNSRRYLCSSWLEGDNCFSKKNDNRKSWDYLISFLKDKKGDRNVFIGTKKQVSIDSKEVMVLFLEVHQSKSAGEVAEKAKWLNEVVIQKFIKNSNLKNNYKIIWLKDGKKYSSPHGERMIKEAQPRYKLQPLEGNFVDLDTVFG